MTIAPERELATSLGDQSEKLWIFTFGPDHKLLIGLDDGSEDGAVWGDGVSLGKRFIALSGTREGARQMFEDLFGPAFCDQYLASEQRTRDMIARHGLIELVVWP
jgi:hypothetical protein